MTLRPATTDDRRFEFELYCSTAAESLQHLDESSRTALLDMQFRAREQSYESQFAELERSIILDEAGNAVGRLLIAEMVDEIRLVDIAVLDDTRGRGLGSAVLQRLFDRFDTDARPVRFHVAKSNTRAQRLYARFGAVVLADEGLYLYCEFRLGE